MTQTDSSTRKANSPQHHSCYLLA